MVVKIAGYALWSLWAAVWLWASFGSVSPWKRRVNG